MMAGVISFSIPTLAEPTYSEKTKLVSIEDKADILTEEEESALLTTAVKMSKEKPSFNVSSVLASLFSTLI